MAEFFSVGGGKRKLGSSCYPPGVAQAVLEPVRAVLVTDLEARHRFQRLLRKHRYLGGLKALGEQLYYAAVDTCQAPPFGDRSLHALARSAAKAAAISNRFLIRHGRK